MTALLKQDAFAYSILDSIAFHPAWLGDISGLKAEKMLRNKDMSYLYVLREGEHEMEYYVTFVDADLNVSHRPFVITYNNSGEWFWENHGGGGPHREETSINDIIHIIMSCEKGQCTPFINFEGN